MGVSVTASSPPEGVDTALGAVRRLPRWFEDRHGWIAAAIYLLVIVWYEHALFKHFGSSCSCLDTDPTQWMWSWKWLLYAIAHGHNPLITDRVWNAKGGFDLASVTLAPVTAILGIPLGSLFGTVAAYNIVMFLAPVMSGWAAYRLCRYISAAPWASVLAGYTYGFSAFELGHLLGHLNLIFVFIPPMLIHLVLRYLDAEISRRRALIGAIVLLLIQFGLSTEVFFDMTYLGFVALVIAFVVAPQHRRKLIEVAILLVLAYLVTALICSYYIYEEQRGPQESGGAAAGFPADLLSYLFPTTTFKIGGDRLQSLSGSYYTNNQFEQDSYLGLPLCGILLAFAVSSWRLRVVKIVCLSSLVAFILSLGVDLTIGGHGTIALPYDWLQHRPLFKLTTPSRLGLFVSLGAAIAVALWISWAPGRLGRIWRWCVGLLAVAFLLPNTSLPGRINNLYQPTFFTTGVYKKFLTPNEVVMTIPFSGSGETMLWQADASMYYRMIGGYLGYPPPNYSQYPITLPLWLGTSPPAMKQAVPELKQLLRAHPVGAALVQPGNDNSWKPVLEAVHFQHVAIVAGMSVWKAPAGL